MAKKLKNQNKADFIKPRLRVFFSVDLTGSTEYKIANSGEKGGEAVTGWPTVMMAFYATFQRIFQQNWQEWKDLVSAKDESFAFGSPPNLWKALGDELIFWKECTSENEVIGVVQVWRKSLADFLNDWQYVDSLSIKSGAWTVGSPIRNWELAVSRKISSNEDIEISEDPIVYNFKLLREYYNEKRTDINIDFIGPSMDCGFRLLKFAEERKLILSADLAFLLHESVNWWSRKKFLGYPDLKFYFSETAELKGICRKGINYPIIWLDCYPSYTNLKSKTVYSKAIDILEGRQEIPGPTLRSFLTEFLDELDGFPDAPYICQVNEHGDIREAFGEIPSAHIDLIDKYRAAYLAGERDEHLAANATEEPKDNEVKSKSSANPSRASIDFDELIRLLNTPKKRGNKPSS